MSGTEIIKYIGQGLIVLILIYTVAFLVLFFVLLPHQLRLPVPYDGPLEYAKGGPVEVHIMDNVNDCFNPYRFDECGGVIPVIYWYVIILVSVPMLLLLFKPIESIFIFFVIFIIGFYLHDKKNTHE